MGLVLNLLKKRSPAHSTGDSSVNIPDIAQTSPKTCSYCTSGIPKLQQGPLKGVFYISPTRLAEKTRLGNMNKHSWLLFSWLGGSLEVEI